MIKVIQRIVIVLAVLSAGLMAAAGLKNAGVHDTDGPEITMDQDSITVPVECTAFRQRMARTAMLQIP